MINELKVIQLKFLKNWLTYTPFIFTIFFIFCMNMYAKTNWNISFIKVYTASYNAVTSLILAVLVYQVIKFEENIGHFNHILSKPSRLKWAISTLIYIYINYIFSLFISSANLIIMSHNFKLTLFYFITSLFLNIIITVILFLIGLLLSSVLAIVSSVFLTIFNIYFGIEVLGDNSWFYIPITYSTRYTAMYIENNLHPLMTLTIYTLSLIICYIVFSLFLRKWSGRKIND